MLQAPCKLTLLLQILNLHPLLLDNSLETAICLVLLSDVLLCLLDQVFLLSERFLLRFILIHEDLELLVKLLKNVFILDDCVVHLGDLGIALRLQIKFGMLRLHCLEKLSLRCI